MLLKIRIINCANKLIYPTFLFAQSDGNKLVLRCGGESERNDWLTNLQRMSIIDTPIPGSLVKEGPTALLAREGSLKKKKNNVRNVYHLRLLTVDGVVSS